MTIYIYSNETGHQVDNRHGNSWEECLAWADAEYGSNDYHYSESDVPVSNAVEE